MTLYGGQANAHRVKDICDRAHRWLAAGRAAVELAPCECFYEDGKPKFEDTKGVKVHVCGRN